MTEVELGSGFSLARPYGPLVLLDWSTGTIESPPLLE